VGLAVQVGDSAFDPFRFGRRIAYLIVLSFVLIWFGFNKFRPPVRGPSQVGEQEPDGELPIAAALDYAALHSRARRVLFAWWHREEPWTTVTIRKADGQISSTALGPDELGAVCAPLDPGQACLFDLRSGRALRFHQVGSVKLEPMTTSVSAEFASSFDITQGLCTFVRAAEVEGCLFFLDVPGLASDDLETAQQVAANLTSAFDRHSSRVAAQSAAEVRARQALARDLHDSVSQTLAGAAFQLETVLRSLRAGLDAEPALLTLKGALLSEQRHVRELIGELRTGTIRGRAVDAGASLVDLCRDLARQWGLDVPCTVPEQEVRCPAWLNHELRQIVREAVANSARHGNARQVGVGLATSGNRLLVSVDDDGRGLGLRGETVRPWSIEERAALLGGSVALTTGESGTRLEIQLPAPDGFNNQD
jgi:signal transduction histidine kinase